MENHKNTCWFRGICSIHISGTPLLSLLKYPCNIHLNQQYPDITIRYSHVSYVIIYIYIYIYHYISPLDTNKINDFPMFSPPLLQGRIPALRLARAGEAKRRAKGFQRKASRRRSSSSPRWRVDSPIGMKYGNGMGFTMKNRFNIWAFMGINPSINPRISWGS